MTDDAVDRPSHYTTGGIEVLTYLRAKMTPDEFRGFCKGNIIKYLTRAGHKIGVDAKQDYAKAAFYASVLMETFGE